MPTLTISKDVDVEVDFQVYCGICGSGCCDETLVDNRRLNITVTCPTCQKVITKLETEKEELYERINRANGTI
jgi:hypothetical protein